MTQKQFERGLSAALIVIALAFFAVEAKAQTPATLLPQPKMQFLTDGGLVCNGCKVYTYAAGTTTPLATYTSASGAVTNANPVILDSAGRADIWFTNLSYKVVLKTSADVTIWTEDNVSSFCTITGCSMTGQLTITGPAGASVTTTSSAGSTFISSASGGFGLTGNSSNVGGNTAGVEGIAASANGTAFLGWNTAVGGLVFQGLSRNGSTTVFTVSNTGAVSASSTISSGAITAPSIAINGGTALTTTNQTGTGNLVLATAPSISAPAITGNMTYANTTPVANLTASNHPTFFPSGTQATSAKVYTKTVQLVAGTLVHTFTNSFAFSNTNFVCSVNDISAAALASYGTKTTTSITITGTGADFVDIACTGN